MTTAIAKTMPAGGAAKAAPPRALRPRRRQAVFRTTVLESVELDVRPGEVVALLGENGAGKSTFSANHRRARAARSGSIPGPA